MCEKITFTPGYYFPTRQVGNQICLELNNGRAMPLVGLGTWQSKPEDTRKAVRDCIKAGYRLIDTAFLYLNEEAVGDELQALFKEGVVKREDIFVTTKLHLTQMQRDDPVPNLKSQLAKLKLDYVDLYLIHWPLTIAKVTEPDKLFPIDPVTGVMKFDYTAHYTETWKGMEDCYRLGLTKAIGISNFNIRQTENILLRCNIRPAVNQIESHPYLTNRKLIQFCQTHNIAVTAYSTFANPGNSWFSPDGPKYPKPMQDERLKKITAKYRGKTIAQVMLRYQIQRGVAVIPKSVHEERIKENLNIFDFNLSNEDMEAIEGIDQGLRVLYLGFWKGVTSSRDYPFDEYRDVTD